MRGIGAAARLAATSALAIAWVGACASSGGPAADRSGAMLSTPVTALLTTSLDAATVHSAEAVLRAAARTSAGVAVAVRRNGEAVWLAGAGSADVDSGTPVDPSGTRFRIYSVVKPMTAVAALRLAEAGRLDPNAPVTRYVPEFPETSSPVTPLQLGTHTSGVRHYADEAEALDPGHCDTVGDALPIFASDPLVREPGTAESYSSWGFVLLSAVIAAIEERAFPAAMETLVFRAAGMTGMALDDPTGDVPGRATPYERPGPGDFRPAPRVDNTCKWGAGGYVGTADDIARFGGALIDGSLVSARGLQMFLRGSESYTARGIGPGGTAILRVHQPSGTAIALLGNTSGAAATNGLERAMGELADLFQH